MTRSVRCPRCGRIMPLQSLVDGKSMACPQCKYEATPAEWTSNVFACGKTVRGSLRAMMAWRRQQEIL